MGEAATSPEIAHLMLSPLTMKACLDGEPVDFGKLKHFTDRDYVIQRMGGGYVENIERLVACLPTVGIRQINMQILAWRVDIPPRALLYHGGDMEVDLGLTPPYLLEKSSKFKLPYRTISGISSLDFDLDLNFQNCLKSLLVQEIVDPHSDFADHPYHKVRMGPTDLHTTTLAEAINLFTGPTPFRTSNVPLNKSEKWDENHIDDRYAEKQIADNGARFRDWATVYHDENEIRRSRMASHAIKFGVIFETHFPLAAQWVKVASTIQSETRVLRHMGGNSNLEVLRRSVDGRFMRDSKLLPVRNKGDVVELASMELYSDPSGQVLLAYAPTTLDGSKTIEFMSFRLN
jgi:hypothetical protein